MSAVKIHFVVIHRKLCDDHFQTVISASYFFRNKIIDAVFEVAEGGGPLTSSIARKVLEMFPRFNAAKTETETLTDREKDVLGLLVKGHSYKMVAAELNITLETVRSHIKKIYEKLHVHNSGEAIAIALRNRLV